MLKNQKQPRNDQDIEELKNLVLDNLNETSASDITLFSTSEAETALASYMIVATGRSLRSLDSISKNLARSIKHNLGFVPKKSGEADSGWQVIDMEDIIVHILTEEKRGELQLEQFWSRENDAQDSE
jgi:ribosome-associated protein